MAARTNSTGWKGVGRAVNVFRNWFRLGRARIGTRLTACFAVIVLSMMAADVVAIWQFSQTTAAARRLNQADQTSLAVVHVHLDVDTFRDSVAASTSTHDVRQFATEAAFLRRKFVEDVAHSQELLASSPATSQDPIIGSALETLRMTLPAQLDTTVKLASVRDWPAVSLRVANQIQALINLSSLLVEKVDRQVLQERAQTIENAQRARRRLLFVLPATALLTLLIAIALGWYATQTITRPLSALDAGAQALARGDFEHQVVIEGEDELAHLGWMFNESARRLAVLYQTLRTNEARFRLTIDTIPGYVWSALPDGSLDFINQPWLDFAGLSREEGLGWGWEATVHPEDLAGFVDEWRAAVACGKAMETEARVRRADGQYRWLLIRNVPLRDEVGNIIKWYGTSTDITDRKHAEEALRRSEAYLAEGQRLSHTGSWTWNPAGADRNYWSEEMFRIFGFELREGPPPLERFLQRIHPEDRDRATKGWEKTFRDKVNIVQDFRTVLPDGTVRDIHIIGHPVLDGTGELVEYVGTAIDVTERKRAEQERERLRQLEADLAHINRVSLLGELAASISHELKQPITGAITSARACLRWLNREEPDLERARAAAVRIDKDGGRAAEIIDRLRALYKKTPPKREPVDVNEVIGEMAVMLRSEAYRFGVSVRTELAAGLLSLTADRVQLHQVLMNLMLNAIEAMNETGGVLTVKSQEDENGQVLISVSDTGVGLPLDKADQIFNAFFTTKPQGSGMGLAISRSIVESHGGRLWATPNDGRGATFQFTLPVQAEEQE